MQNNPVYKMLIVEDEEQMRELYTTVVKRTHHAEILSTDNGEEAIKLIKNEKPVLVIQDIIIKGNLMGWDVIREVRKFDQKVKFIVLSANPYHESFENIDFIKKFSISSVLAKPIKVDQFKKEIDKVLAEDITVDEIIPSKAFIELKGSVRARQLLHYYCNALTVMRSELEIHRMKSTTELYSKTVPPADICHKLFGVIDNVVNEIDILAEDMQKIREL